MSDEEIWVDTPIKKKDSKAKKYSTTLEVKNFLIKFKFQKNSIIICFNLNSFIYLFCKTILKL